MHGKKQWKANIPYNFSVLRTLEIVTHIRISDYPTFAFRTIVLPAHVCLLPS